MFKALILNPKTHRIAPDTCRQEEKSASATQISREEIAEDGETNKDKNTCILHDALRPDLTYIVKRRPTMY